MRATYAPRSNKRLAYLESTLWSSSYKALEEDEGPTGKHSQRVCQKPTGKGKRRVTVLQYNIEPSSIQSRNAEGSDSQEQ